ncbi:UDP-N-acetylglucosamine--dolichyl-phosphate N-acetylglucosaminephosphotransferase-like protein [Neocallimastix californiae]|uniref:UDP-N-acetylglucosamine--dolichyl-phosphate N-acetylglucosaminephosphotransferase n=1 Tax=Neocallimastix californiae TaxID=1754190 RepID=A0A1Y2EXB9_9FUNG|nr:UDP-N-acetylglucosamine--dolichyl-phosphate N-acetylglucosaminephosphotransferase-like protein [Neocallimastix californiae]|eukprot:ORY75894.1 UDP-N-acetylglucosamine--dolichyl-phosphate N-acetylglucosaminephosphotransferase-like protein [Neocallimastix californiae]
MIFPTWVFLVILFGISTLTILKEPLYICILASVLAGYATHKLIPSFKSQLVKAHLFGNDLHKADKRILPEATGIISGMSYIVCLCLLIPFPFLKWFLNEKGSKLNEEEFPHHKILFPTIASLPLLMVYIVSYGVTTIVVPIPLRPIFGRIIELGPLYYIYMGMVAVFCTNAINILAGINGLEVSQSIVIALSLIINDIHFILTGAQPAVEAHTFSLFFLIPFVGVSIPLLWYNWYPAQVFVGDSFCYFAGMTFAVVGILGHFSKTLLLFFIPQIFNFLYSVPQIFKLVECPRHRLPSFNEEDKKLYPSRADLTLPGALTKYGKIILKIFEILKLADIEYDKETKEMKSVNNLTLLNLFLVRFGPRYERNLAVMMVIVQVLSSLLAFFIRYKLVNLVY